MLSLCFGVLACKLFLAIQLAQHVVVVLATLLTVRIAVIRVAEHFVNLHAVATILR